MPNQPLACRQDADDGRVAGTEDEVDRRSPAPHDQRGKGVVRITAFLPTEVWERVGAYAQAHRTTKTATLRRAISVLWFLHRRPDAQLLCEYPDGRVERLFFLDDGDRHEVLEPSPTSRRRRTPVRPRSNATGSDSG